MFTIVNGMIGQNPGKDALLFSMPKQERQQQGWFCKVVIDPSVTIPTEDVENDCIRAPVPVFKEATITPKPRSLSRIKLYRALKAMGYGPILLAYLSEDADRQFQWYSSVTLDENDPLIIEAIEAFKAQLGLTTEQIESLFANCISDIV